jgi:Tol biopolymer transport system component
MRLLRFIMSLSFFWTLLIAGTLAYGTAFPGDEIVAEMREERIYSTHLIDLRTHVHYPLPLHSPSLAHPQWSPDGSRLIYVVSEGNYDSLYVTDGHGRFPRRLLTEDVLLQSVINFTWSPDGSQIVATTRTSLWILDVEGIRSPRNVVPYSGVEFRAVAWSPDGTRLAFSYSSSLAFYRSTMGIYDLQSGELSGLGRGDDPHWSPDGSRMVFVSGTRIMIRDMDSQTPVDIAEGFAPLWSPDGEWIAFSQGFGSPVDLMLYHVETGQMQTLLSNGATNIVSDWRPHG